MLGKILRTVFSLVIGVIINSFLAPWLNDNISDPPATGVRYDVIWILSFLSFSGIVLMLISIPFTHSNHIENEGNAGTTDDESGNEVHNGTDCCLTCADSEPQSPNFLTSADTDPTKIPMVEKIDDI